MSAVHFDRQSLLRQLLQNEAVRNRLLPPVSDEELVSINRHLPVLAADAEQWASRWPTFNRATIIAVSLQACVQLDYVPYDAMLTRVKHALWIYALDDAMDAPALTETAARDLLNEVFGAACGFPLKKDASTLARSLAEIQAALAVQPLYSLIYPVWLVSLVKVGEGMMFENWLGKRAHQCAGVAALPAEYMDFAHNSIAVPHLWITNLMFETAAAIAGDLDRLVALAEQCGTVVRLVNDLCSYDREVAEGRINAVSLRAQELMGMGHPEGQAVAFAKQEIGTRVEVEQARMRTLAAAIKGGRTVQERFLRGTDFSVDLYLRQDFRDFESEVQRAIRTGT